MKTYIAYTVLALVLLVGLVAVKALLGFTPRDTAGDRREVQHKGVSLVYFALGGPRAPVLVMIPSLGRSASDFNELAETPAASGYRELLVEPRGMRTKGGLDNDRLTLFDLADTSETPEHTAELLEAEFAGRAILPKQPEKIGSAVLDFAGLHLSH